jgi:hypothetical protein
MERVVQEGIEPPLDRHASRRSRELKSRCAEVEAALEVFHQLGWAISSARVFQAISPKFSPVLRIWWDTPIQKFT